MRYNTVFVVVCTFCIVQGTLICYQGKQRWDPEPVINNVTLAPCGLTDECCYMISSLDGTEYGCYKDCPARDFHQCGPDPKLGIQDIRYCYCLSHTDQNCIPYLGKENESL